VDRALEAEAKAILRATRAWIEDFAEEDVTWVPRLGAAREPERPARTPSPAAPPRASAHGEREALVARSAPEPLRESAAAPAAGPRPTLEEVRQLLGECTRCPLHAGRNKIVFGDGNPSAEILFVGEGPGEQEDLSGLPFVGRAGELLTRMIEAGLQIPRASVYIANVVKCRPPGNRTPLPTEVATCREFLDGQIDAIRPRVIVALGKPATSLLLGRDVSITRMRGTWHTYRGFPVMPTFHPAFLLRQYTPENRRLVWQDLKAALERARAG
jgi:DNA polymerase